MQSPNHNNGRVLRRLAITGGVFYTALVGLFAVLVDPGTAVSILAPFWLMTMLIAVGSYAVAAWLGTRTPAEAATDDRVTAAA